MRPTRALTRRGTAALAALATTSCLFLAACSGDEDTPAADPTSSSSAPAEQDVAEGTTLDATWPLTGLTVKNGTADKKYPVMVTKIDNTSSSAPQRGLGSADMVVEELVEGGYTRLAVFFYSTMPDLVGPVRSMRASDIGIVGPADANVVTSGAANVTINRIDKAGITWFTEGDKGFFRDSARYSPYNLMDRLDETVTLARTDKAARPDDYLPFGEMKENPKGAKAVGLAAGFGTHVTQWSYSSQSRTYSNVNGYAADGDEFDADSVLVLRVQVGDAGYRDPAGNYVPETKFTGTGQAMLFHGGRVVRGTWNKKSLESNLTLSTGQGKKKRDLVVPAGHTWIELVPADTGSVSISAKR
ncbi:DUF3048 domain-containing protein [Nocardioides bruguierae]|uniref:DUF3048 domain-containing protein n=1 Tax=Nocardioides bruguierae TaxID=2945102 RepID=A0A9X2IE54_9ACTN|nr:DUF3048 domain-containing protein [Nocardioides bruguierae]MCM0620481.1 DUF3048 domain-containing protein [Nocardioides bruguierae]